MNQMPVPFKVLGDSIVRSSHCCLRPEDKVQLSLGFINFIVTRIPEVRELLSAVLNVRVLFEVLENRRNVCILNKSRDHGE